MWYPASIVTPAASEPIELAEAKAQCRVLHSDQDAKIEALIAAARSHVEGYCGTPLVSRTISVKCDAFGDFARFPVVPVSSATIEYVDTAGAVQTLPTNVYELRSDGLVASIDLKHGQSWPAIQSGSRISVEAVVGYSDTPDAIKHAMHLLIAHWFATREAAAQPMQDIPMGVEALLSNHRSFTF